MLSFSIQTSVFVFRPFFSPLAITMHLDMLEEFLVLVLKEEGPNHT